MSSNAMQSVAVFAGEPGKSASKSNQARFVQRHERPASSISGAQKLLGWSDKVQRKAGSKAAARVEPVYTETNKGKSLAELWTAYPEARKDILWDYQHGHLELSDTPA